MHFFFVVALTEFVTVVLLHFCIGMHSLKNSLSRHSSTFGISFRVALALFCLALCPEYKNDQSACKLAHLWALLNVKNISAALYCPDLWDVSYLGLGPQAPQVHRDLRNILIWKHLQNFRKKRKIKLYEWKFTTWRNTNLGPCVQAPKVLPESSGVRWT